MKIRLLANGDYPQIHFADRGWVDVREYRDGEMFYVDNLEIIHKLCELRCVPVGLTDGGEGDFLMFNARLVQPDKNIAAFFEKATNDGYKHLVTKRGKVFLYRDKEDQAGR